MAFKKLKLWFDKELAQMLAKKIKPVYPDFPSRSFILGVDQGVGPLELKARVELMADQLQRHLPGDYAYNCELLLQTLGPENEKETGMFTDFYWIMPMAKYVEKYGLDDFKVSMNMIKEITKRNTGEYTIRPFIERYPKKTMKLLLKWSKDDNFHVRRLASEGPRPRLPWAPKLQQFIDDPAPLLPILDQLKDDKSKYVQKSVANAMNDILKDHPELGRAVLERWAEDAGKERRWIIKHALRNFLKRKVTWAGELVNW